MAAKANTGCCPENAVADWVGTRFYAVDNELGSDGNLGNSDVSMALAGGVAVKTPERLDEIIPPLGNPNQSMVIAFKIKTTGVYLGPDGVTIANFIKTLTGYGPIIIRSTADFSDSATDRTLLASESVLGPYTVDAGSTVNSITVVGGGLPVDYSGQGYRIRFTSGALSASYATWYANTAAAITCLTLASAPVAGVTFVVERPAVKLGAIDVNIISDESVTPVINTCIQGFECQTRFAANGTGALTLGALNVTGSATFSVKRWALLNGTGVYTPVPTSTSASNSAWGIRFNSTGTHDIDVKTFFAWSRCTVRTSGSLTWKYQDTQAGVFSNSYLGKVGGACNIIAVNPIVSADSTSFDGILGRRGVSTSLPFLIGGTATYRLRGNVGLYGVQIEESAFLEYQGTGLSVTIDDLTGSTTNTYPVSIEKCTLSKFLIGTKAANTASGTAGIGFAANGSNPVLWTGFALTNIVDLGGNDLQGTAGKIVSSSLVVRNLSGVTYAVGDVVRGNGTTNQSTTAQGDVLANAEYIGVVLNGVVNNADCFISGGPYAIVNFDGVPVYGAIAYLSPGTARALTTTIPALAATNRKLRVGRVVGLISGTLAKVALSPECLSILADGLA